MVCISNSLIETYKTSLEAFKIYYMSKNFTVSHFFAFSSSTVTRGHQNKIYVNHSRGVRKYFFAERVVGLGIVFLPILTLVH